MSSGVPNLAISPRPTFFYQVPIYQMAQLHMTFAILSRTQNQLSWNWASHVPCHGLVASVVPGLQVRLLVLGPVGLRIMAESRAPMAY